MSATPAASRTSISNPSDLRLTRRTNEASDAFTTSNNTATTATATTTANCVRKGAVLNNFIFLAISVLTLWISSYRVATLVTNNYLPTPSYKSVSETCTSSYRLILEQNDLFNLCTKNSLASCFNLFDISKILLNNEMLVRQNQTELAISQLQSLSSFCNSNLTSYVPALRLWGLFDNATTTVATTTDSIECSSNNNNNSSIIKSRTSSAGQVGKLSLCNCTAKKRSLMTNSSTDVLTALEGDRFLATSEADSLGALSYIKILNDYNSNYLKNATSYIPQLLSLSFYNESLRWKQKLDITTSIIYRSSLDLIDCFSFASNATSSTLDKCPGGVSVRNVYDTYVAAAIHESMRLAHLNSVFIAELASYKHEVTDAVMNIESFYNSINGARGLINWLKDQKIISINLNLCGKSSPDFCSFSLNDFDIPATLLTMPYPTEVPIPDFHTIFDELISSDLKSLDERLVQLADSIDSFNSGFDASISAIKLGLFSDYQPPLYSNGEDVDSIKAKIRQRSENYRNYTLESQKAQFDSNKIDLSSLENMNFPSITSQVSISKIDLLWLPFDYTDINIEPFIRILSDFNSVLMALDLVYRIISTLAIFYKGYRSKLIIIDPFDLRLDNEKSLISDKSKGLLHITQSFLAKAWLQIAVVLAVVTSIVVLLVMLFNFEFHSYQQGCLGEDPASHTFFSSKLYSASYNMASFEGNRHASAEISKYNYELSTQSTKLMEDWKVVFDDLHSRIATNNASIDFCLRKFDAFKSCLDGYSSLSSQYEQSCRINETTTLRGPAQDNSAIGGGDYDDYGSLLNEKKCRMYPLDFEPSASLVFDRLQDILYNTSYPTLSYKAFPACESTCKGPDTNVLFVAAKSCSCMAEWLFNASIVRGAVALLFFISINLSRVLLVRGVCFILWTKLESPNDVYEVRLNCDKDGKLLQLESGTISDDINGLERSFHTKGYIYITAAIGLTFSWVYIFPAINYSTTYDPNSL